MASIPKLSSLFTWALYFVPIYIFALDPLLRPFFPALPSKSLQDRDIYNDWDLADLPPALNTTDDTFISPEDGVPFNCPGVPAGYHVHLLSRAPLIIYLENFVSDQEVKHILDVSLTKYTPSIVYDGVTERIDSDVRLSERGLLERDDVIRCLEDRARAFQGWRPHLYIERMWAQRYNVSGHYRHHFDWTGSFAQGGDRISTFMVYLDADCEGGGTNFPRLRMPPGKEWCRFLECDDDQGNKFAPGERKEGITFKPIKGNAVFWQNLRPDGSGYPETWHASYPVTAGTKVGLNIWSWYQPPKRDELRG
ncbi:Prolyl 4-hydroxylase alpha subunit [Penicillium taxi]|uniref:Prolyl 4-hydroxylase alpha subunit n=1 Tax=Penicillium taxi TaxID=168475 RepID=UPI0025459D39|nr:Prolyl 4-hydroxylase alpha subunit [Penicillium taxi]KAJ5887864.1 Prolyl 4-hydroxylase alpha subunit [Penicillium taxi]